MKTTLSFRFGLRASAVLFSMLAAGCGSISIVRPAGQNGQRAVAQIPVIAEAKWQQTTNVKFLVDGQDRTMEFAPSGNSATHALSLEPGPHTLKVEGDVSCSYCSGGVNHQATIVEFDANGTLAANPTTLSLAVGETKTFVAVRTPVLQTYVNLKATPKDETPNGHESQRVVVGGTNPLFAGREDNAENFLAGAATTSPIQVTGVQPGSCRIELFSQYYSPATLNVTVTNATTPPPVADFSVNAPGIIAVPGGHTTLVANVVRNAQMHDPVTLSTVGAPPGVTIGGFDPTPVSPTQSSASANVAVSSSVAIGSYPITVRGIGAGLTRTTSTILQVMSFDPQTPRSSTDCGCSATGDWVEPAGFINTATSPDGAVTLTTSQNGNTATLALSRQSPSCNRVIGPIDLSSSIAWGFSPHSKYFVIARYVQNMVSIDFYDLTACNSPPFNVSLNSYQPPAEGAFAGWGFGPGSDDSRFAIEAVNPQMQVEFFLVNVPAHRFQSIGAPPAADQPHGTFSPCGDLYGIKDVINFPTARIVFTLFRTRDFASVPATGPSSVEITSTYRDAFLNTNAHWHRLKRSLVAQSPGEFEPESSWPNIVANGASGPCN